MCQWLGRARGQGRAYAWARPAIRSYCCPSHCPKKYQRLRLPRRMGAALRLRSLGWQQQSPHQSPAVSGSGSRVGVRARVGVEVVVGVEVTLEAGVKVRSKWDSQGHLLKTYSPHARQFLVPGTAKLWHVQAILTHPALRGQACLALVASGPPTSGIDFTYGWSLLLFVWWW